MIFLNINILYAQNHSQKFVYNLYKNWEYLNSDKIKKYKEYIKNIHTRV